jgi:membrane protein
MLVWIYYSSMILLFGAEFTQAWSERRGSGIVPEPGAVRVVQEKKQVREGQPAAARAG